MANFENPGIWEKIQRNVQETERLLGQKKYTASMIRARQTLEYMVQLQCDRAGIVESSLDNMIRELYQAGAIKKSTAEHYMQIMAIGKKAVEKDDNSPGNANEAYHILSQEVYSFANAGNERPRRRPAAAVSQSSSSRQAQTRRRKQPSSGINGPDLLKLLIPVVLIIVLIFVIRMFTPKKPDTIETQPSTPAFEQTMPQATEAVTETPTEASVSYKTTTTLNVRKGPSTDTDRIGKLDPDVPVEYLRDHDDKWAVILYNGTEAYVAKEYLVPAE